MESGDRESTGRPDDLRVIALLGAALALVAASASEGLLMPQIEASTPRALGLFVTLGGFGLAAWLGASIRRPPLVAGGALLVGALLAVALIPALKPELLTRLLHAGGLRYFTAMGLGVGLVALPIVLPLGALTQWTLTDSGARGRTVWLLGASCGLALAPWLTQVQLGHADTLASAGLLAGGACFALRGGARRATPGLRLQRGAAVDLVLIGVALGLLVQRLRSYVDLGDVATPWWAGGVTLGALLGMALGPRLPRALVMPAVALLPAAFAFSEPLNDLPEPGILGDLYRLAWLALPAGLALGARLRPGDEATSGSLPWLCAPALTALGATLVPVLVLQHTGTRAAAFGLGALTLVALFATRPSPKLPQLIGGLALAALCAFVGLRPPGDVYGVDSQMSWVSLEQPGGTVGYAVDASAEPSTRRADGSLTLDEFGGDRIAYDGRFTRAWSRPRHRRLVHVPALLHGRVGGALIVAADRGEAADAMLRHGDVGTHWLRPLDGPMHAQRPAEGGAWPDFMLPIVADERAFLQSDGADYDLILLLPDPRVRHRMARVATVEFYEQASRRLLDGGLFCQWWDVGAVDISDLKSALASAQLAFPFVYTVVDHPRARRGLLGILGRHEPLQVWPATVDDNLASHTEIGADFARDGLDGLLTACLVLHDAAQLRLLAPPEVALHDERPVVGLRGGLRPLPQPETLAAGLTARALSPVDPMGWIRVPPERVADVHAHVLDVRRGWTALFEAARSVVRERGARLVDFDVERPREILDVEAEALARALAVLPDWPYLSDQILACAAGWEARGQVARAETLLRRSIDWYHPSSARLRHGLAALVERKGDLADARELYGTVLAFEPEHVEARAALARLAD